MNLCFLLMALWCSDAAGGPLVEVAGLGLRVADPVRAEQFLVQALLFKRHESSGSEVVLERDGVLVVLVADRNRGADRHDTIYLNFSVPDLKAATRACLEKGGELMNEAPMMSQIGPFNGIRIPGSKQRIHLMQIEGMTVPEGVFNVSMRVSDMALEENFYKTLGILPFSRDYLPETLPFLRSGPLGMVIHPLTAGQGARAAQCEILLTAEVATAKKMTWSRDQRFRSPSGYGFRLYSQGTTEASKK